MFFNDPPTKEECEAMQRVRNKMKDAGLIFDLSACVLLAKIFTFYNVEEFVREKETIPTD